MDKKIETVYVKLLNEDIEVWRPVISEKNTSNLTYKLLSYQGGDYINDEMLEFELGSVVICEEKELEGKKEKIAIKKV